MLPTPASVTSDDDERRIARFDTPVIDATSSCE
jgi:hypothetical protein